MGLSGKVFRLILGGLLELRPKSKILSISDTMVTLDNGGGFELVCDKIASQDMKLWAIVEFSWPEKKSNRRRVITIPMVFSKKRISNSWYFSGLCMNLLRRWIIFINTQ